MINGATFTGSTYDAQTVWPSGFDPVAAGAIGVGINQAPTFTTSSTFSTPENQITAFQVSANDPEGSAVTFSVTGTDASLFSINAATGQLTFNTPPDFEAEWGEFPGSISGTNQYSVTVQATDGAISEPVGHERGSQTITITVTDVVEIRWRPNTVPVSSECE